jgi:Mg2+ and Co2+ transporter CorA
MIIDCAHYRDGCRQGVGPVAVEEATALHVDGGFVWLGMFEPTPEELARVRDGFGLHELAVEDAQTFHMRPKVESYDGEVQLVILRTARYDDPAEEVEFGGAVHPLLAVVSTLEREADAYLAPYLRDVHDHLVLVTKRSRPSGTCWARSSRPTWR